MMMVMLTMVVMVLFVVVHILDTIVEMVFIMIIMVFRIPHVVLGLQLLREAKWAQIRLGFCVRLVAFDINGIKIYLLLVHSLLSPAKVRACGAQETLDIVMPLFHLLSHGYPLVSLLFELHSVFFPRLHTGPEAGKAAAESCLQLQSASHRVTKAKDLIHELAPFLCLLHFLSRPSVRHVADKDGVQEIQVNKHHAHDEHQY